LLQSAESRKQCQNAVLNELQPGQLIVVIKIISVTISPLETELICILYTKIRVVPHREHCLLPLETTVNAVLGNNSYCNNPKERVNALCG
jgi:hypothetical protein